MRNHLGTSFKVWKRRQIWFWLVRNQYGNSSAIGTAASEAEAVSEACYSIEEMAAQRPSLPASRGLSVGKALMPALNQAYPCDAAFGWMDRWMSITHQLTDKMLTRWAGLVLGSG